MRMQPKFNLGLWLKGHPARLRKMLIRYSELRKDGQSVDDALAVTKAEEVEAWLEETA